VHYIIFHFLDNASASDKKPVKFDTMEGINTQEIECRFLEVDKDVLIKKLLKLGAENKGEVMLEETIIYDPECKWSCEILPVEAIGRKFLSC
jgi:hypothetical protein